jgi:hypothetical protein
VALKCAGCGRQVSEFAARCPACHHATGDAEVLTPETDSPGSGIREALSRSAAAGQAAILVNRKPGGRRRVPRLGLAAVAIAALAVAGSVVGVRVASGAQPGPGGGRIVSVDFDGIVVLSDSDGQHRTWLSRLGIFQNQGMIAAPDNRFLVTSSGRLISVQHDGLAPTDVSATVGNLALFGFADHDDALVGLEIEGPDPRPTVEIVSLADSRMLTLGRADEVAGDPEAVGAFVTMPAATQPGGPPPPGGYAGEADRAVELQDYGKPTAVLATSTQLEADLHQRPGPVSLEVVPDRQGDKVAVVVNPTATGDQGAGLVVLDRTGRVIGAIPPSRGPIEYSQPAWSPDGSSLAYPSAAPRQTRVTVWRLTGSVSTRDAPDLGAGLSYCLWATTGTRFICASTSCTADQAAEWVVGDSRGGPLRLFPAAGVPLAWLSPPTR